ncbi:testis-specific gene 10 protein-like [Leguminivora glycinivorella]|uniref:testis-specific gene 10 protein-like n=1 Tax=Leguminivora glycinivorella TaxID=1035111 RepID=UPI00200F1C6D|nr:testis-specific gene 10 protein-like [Leguminivora glycinivorella]
MNIADIEKVANRKRINAEAEKLREKVNKETANIIKLKVAQDTAYWDLKEKLHQLENNHERLQQNMVEVQMQHEAISGQYQDELRLRPETLNKLSSTREICNILEEYSERLKASVSRCKTDQATLAEAYNKSGQIVREIKDKQTQSEEKNMQIIKSLQEKVKLLADHKDQMSQVFNSSKQQLESGLNDARTKLATALSQKDELFVALNDLSRKLDHTKRELEKKDDNIASLQSDMKKCILEYDNHITDMKNANYQQEKVLKECTSANESLKIALHNQEQFTQSICDQNNKLQEKISSLEEEQIATCEKNEDLESKLKETNLECGKLTNSIEVLNKKTEELKNEINDKKMLLDQSLVEQQTLKHQVLDLEKQKSEIAIELNNAIQEMELRSVKIEELTSTIQELQTKISEMETTLENNKADSATKIEEISVILETKIKLIEEKDKELDSKASTINQLMSDLKNGTNARTKLENNIEKMKKDMETDKNIAKDKENTLSKKIEQMENTAKEREIELSKQMSIILETRKEKDRLQERLNSMQNTIDNIEKEVTGRSASQSTCEQAELDDNAGMIKPAAPPIKRVGIPALKKAQKSSGHTVAKEQSKKIDSLLYNFFSDSDMENDLMADPAQINRHFDAITRGERVSPLSFKRRAPGLEVSGPLDENISLSQLKRAKNKRSLFKSKRPDNKPKIL